MSHYLSHLNAIDLRLSHEMARLLTLKEAKPSAKNDEAIAWREHNVRMIERERAAEVEFLAKHGIEVDSAPEECDMSIDEILAELEA